MQGVMQGVIRYGWRLHESESVCEGLTVVYFEEAWLKIFLQINDVMR
jgi:hypothetical protein